MSFLLRLTSRAKWAEPSGSRESACADFARTPEDTDGLSVYEVASNAERDMVIAATALRRQDARRVDFIEVERAELERYGRIDETPEKGTTPLPAANALHRSLDWSAADLRRLAEDLYDRKVAPTEYPKSRVLVAVRAVDAATVVGHEERAFVDRVKASAQK